MTNAQIQTSDPDIYAVGDAIEVSDFITRSPALVPLAGPANRQGRIPIAFQDATLLSAFAHPNHLLLVGSWGFAHLPPSSISKYNGYIAAVGKPWLPSL